MNRLPPEVLALCAAFVSHADPRPIVPLTHVCRYWRKAITSSPRNWASISTGWKRLVPLCLERAGAVNLTVNITVSETRGIFLRALSPRVSRISHLSLTGYPSIEDAADDIPASPMPNLTSLELEQTVQPAEPFPSNETSAPPLFQNVSNLKSLHLTRIPLYPAVFSITSLVELKLVGYTTPFPFGRFIGFLRSNPDLEVIVLDCPFAGVPVRIPPTEIISLVRLRQLSFTCAEAIDARGLISSISFPRGISLELSSPRANQGADLSLFLPSPPTEIRELLTPITTIKYLATPRALQLSGNNSSFSFRYPQTSLNLGRDLSLFTTTAVREFHVEISPCREYLFWPLSLFPALETLVLVNIAFFPFRGLAFLAGEPVVCPSLKTIAFFDCGVASGVVEELETMVARRNNSTAAWLYRVVIVSSTGTLPNRELIHRLRQFVPCVDVRIAEKLPDLS